MTVAPKYRKGKGRQLENEIASSIVDSGLDPEAKRMPLSGAVAGLKGDIITTLPLAIECKFQQTTKFMDWYKQAEEAVSGNKKAMVVWRKNKGEPFVFMKWGDFLKLYIGCLPGFDKSDLLNGCEECRTIADKKDIA